MFALTLPSRLPNFCSAIRATLGQRQIRQSPGLPLNAHSGNDWGPIPVLTGKRHVVAIIGHYVGTGLYIPHSQKCDQLCSSGECNYRNRGAWVEDWLSRRLSSERSWVRLLL